MTEHRFTCARLVIAVFRIPQRGRIIVAGNARMTTMARLTRGNWIAIVVPLLAAALAAVIGLWKSGGTTNTTSGDRSPIVNGTTGPVEIK
jgi:hypothetical protein